ncbi:MAG: hypothetical protein UT66_C0036G0003 [candidate division CPR2 bacterium GW2011_GWC1_39_9]|uniref:Fimbrial assembly family protein n=1 Tax=candidate division CPR2 bacterium GW2011_GWC2_39_10 TaxID=1618345 RepID=A0A0G0LVW9_UNCC2|nr:MAG: hypothetical protein UT18_C0003G0036 [candidate division CPR2 bacterium GW2011_GWC2_39_10]KKR33594.1 MAG: hypothetical protein UT66_C0036G0003 [candidate division CPR2 bacterium GW2011_GWC1_39_9]
MKINLIPQEKSTEIKEGKSNFLATAAAIVLGICGIVGATSIIGIKNIKEKQLSDYNKSIMAVKTDLMKEDYKKTEQKILTVEEGMADIKTLNEASYKWKKVFEEFEKTVPNELRLVSYTNDKGVVNITAGCDTVESMNQFITTLEAYQANDLDGQKANLFKNIKSTGYMVNQDNKIDFSLSFEVEGGVLWK